MFTPSIHRLRRWTAAVLGLGFVLAASPAAANTWTALPNHGLNDLVVAVVVSGTDL